MPKTLQFYFDVGSPYTYLVSEVLEARAAEAGVTVEWRPFLLGGVFKGASNTMPAAIPAKARYMLADLQRWSKRDGVPFVMSRHFPLNSILPMRVLTAATGPRRVELAHGIMRAYWADDQDVSNPAVLAPLLGADAGALLEAAGTGPVKDALRGATDEAVARGAFGAPTFFVGDEMFWGNDRLDFALEAAQG